MHTLAKIKLSSFYGPASLCLWSILAALPMLVLGIPYGPDTPSHLRFATSFALSLYDGNLFPAWQSFANFGYGDASFRVYSPAIYYLFAFFQAATSDWYQTTLLTFSLLILLSAFGIYYWLRAAGFSATQASLASLLYLFSPFHSNELFQSAMIAQYAAGPLLAFIFGAIEKLSRNDMDRAGRTRSLLVLAAAYGALIYTHIAMTMMAALVIPLYVVLRTERKERKKVLLFTCSGLMLGVMLSAAYWTRLVAELHWIKADTIKPGERYNYASNFLFSAFTTDSMNVWYPGLIALATLGMCIAAWTSFRLSSNSGSQRRWFLTTSAVALFSFLMATPLSQPVWRLLPKLGSIEFPWRWLSVMSLAACGLAGASLPNLVAIIKQPAKRPLALAAVGLIVVAIAFTISYPIRNGLYLRPAEFRNVVASLNQEPGLEEWLPAGANIELARKGPDSLAVSDNGRVTEVVSWMPEARHLHVAEGTSAMLRIRTFYYPLWKAHSASGLQLSTTQAGDGALLVNIPSGAATDVFVTFERPLRERVADAVSLIAFGVFISLLVSAFRLRQRRISTLPSVDTRLRIPLSGN
jgi:hypothetical protein